MKRPEKEISTPRRRETCSRGLPSRVLGEIKSGTSLDQLLAQTYGPSTKVPSVVLAFEKSNPSEPNRSCSAQPAHALLQHDGRCEATKTTPPVIVLGGGLKSGRVLDYTGKPERQLCRLFRSMMEKMNLRPKAFGDARMMQEKV